MSLTCLFIIPIIAVAIAGCVAAICCFWLKRKYRALPKEVPSALITESTLNQSKLWVDGHIDQELEVLIVRRLEAMIAAIKTQIPMIGMLLTQTREDKLKAQAHEELIKLIPEIKQIVCGRFEEQAVEAVGSRNRVAIDEPFEKLTDHLWKSWTCALIGIASAFGLVVGLVEVWLMQLLCN